MDNVKELQEIKDKVALLFKEKAKEASEKIQLWAERILELKRLQTFQKDLVVLEKAKKSEQYAWDAIYVLYAQYSKQVEKEAWGVAEKLLKLVRDILLMK